MIANEADTKDKRIIFKEYINSKGIKHSWITKKTGISQSHLSNVFSARVVLTEQVCKKINNALETNF